MPCDDGDACGDVDSLMDACADAADADRSAIALGGAKHMASARQGLGYESASLHTGSNGTRRAMQACLT